MAKQKEAVQEEAVDTVAVAIRDAFDAGVKSGSTEDEIKLAMVNAGAKFTQVNAIYKKHAVDAGLVMTKEEKATIVNDAVAAHDVSTEEGLNDAVSEVVRIGKGVSEKSALGLIRASAKATGVEVFKKTKQAGPGRKGFASVFYNMLRSNPGISREDAEKYITEQPDREEGQDVSQNVIKHKSHYLGVAKLVNDIHNGVTTVE